MFDRAMVRVSLCLPEADATLSTATVSTDPDADALELIAAGDSRGCQRLMQRHLTRLHALAVRMLGNASDADEVCQDAFLRAWRQVPIWQAGNARFSTWLHQVVLNLCRDRLRSRMPPLQSDGLEALQADGDPEQLRASQDTARLVQTAVNALPERQREALILCHFQGLTNIEAAGVLKLNVDALESLLARARRSLRSGLASLSDASSRKSP